MEGLEHVTFPSSTDYLSWAITYRRVGSLVPPPLSLSLHLHQHCGTEAVPRQGQYHSRYRIRHVYYKGTLGRAPWMQACIFSLHLHRTRRNACRHRSQAVSGEFYQPAKLAVLCQYESADQDTPLAAFGAPHVTSHVARAGYRWGRNELAVRSGEWRWAAWDSSVLYRIP